MTPCTLIHFKRYSHLRLTTQFTSLSRYIRTPTMPILQIQLLGHFQILYEGEHLDTIKQPRLQSLVAYCLLHRHQALARQQLAFLFWPDSPEELARNSLRNLLHQLRHALPTADDFIYIDSQSVRWRTDAPFALDVADFEALLRQAETEKDESNQIAALQQAMMLYQGHLFPNCYDDWIIDKRAQLQEQASKALTHLIRLLENRRDFAAAIGVAQRLLQHDPLREESYQQLMHLYAAEGNYSQVQRVYQECVAILQRELDVSPSAETQAIFEQYLHRTKKVSQSVEASATVVAEPPLIGREDEWKTLLAAWQKAARGNSHLVLIAGEAGIGKTRLAQELLDWAAHQGIPVAGARCYATEGGLTYAAIVEWLRSPALRQAQLTLDDHLLVEVARLLPEIRQARPTLPAAEAMTDSWQRRRLFEALAHALLARRQAQLLFLDDLQWADPETLEWLLFLLLSEQNSNRSRTATAPFLLVATLRSEEVIDNRRLTPLLRELRRNGLITELKLDHLDETATMALARTLIQSQLDAADAHVLFQETEGNPLFIVETLRMSEQEIKAANAQSQSSPHAMPTSLPPKVQALIEARLAQLSSPATDLINLAAVISRAFSFELLHQGSGQAEDEVVSGVEELLQRQLIREQVDSSDDFDFAHDKIREVVYSALSRARRYLLHRAVGEALASIHADDLERISAEAAAHFEKANSLDQAVRYYRRAAIHAASLHAYDRTERLYARTIDLARKLNLASSLLTDIYTERGRVLELTGEYDAAVSVYRELESLARQRGDRQMELTAVARLVTCFVEPSSTHNRELAGPLFARGLQLARILGDYDIESRLLWSKMVEASHYRSDEEAQAAGEASLTIARQHGLDERLAFLLNDLATLLRLSGQQAQAQLYAEEARTLFQARNNLPMLADNLSQQAWSDYHSLDFEGALRFAGECIDICKSIDNRWNMSLATATRGLVLAARGEWGDALVAFEESVHYGRQAGFAIPQTLIASRLGSLLREIGNLGQAHELHLEAHAVTLRQAPFLLHALETQLALDALAANDPESAHKWLQAAQAHVPAGAISRAWIVLADLPVALASYAHQTDEWENALTTVQERIAEVRQRLLPIYLPSLLVTCGECQAASGQEDAAATSYHEAIEIATDARMRPVLWQAHAALMQLYQAQGRSAEAQVEQQKATAHLHALIASLTNPADQERFGALPIVQTLLR